MLSNEISDEQAAEQVERDFHFVTSDFNGLCNEWGADFVIDYIEHHYPNLYAAMKEQFKGAN